MGRRVQKTVYAYAASTFSLQSTHLYTYNGWNLVKETTIPDGGSAVDKYYVWGLDLSQSLQGAGGVGGLLAVVDSSLTYQYLYDANGNVGQVVNGSDGSIAAHYEYDPFGNLVTQTGDYADENPYRFSTKYHDAETNLYYYGYRYYSAFIGRWISRDPIGEISGNNLYESNLNNPICLFDLVGLFAEKKEPSPYNWDIGKKAHTRISAIVKSLYDGKPIGDGTDRVWELEFDRTLKKILLGDTRHKPDIINTCYPKLIWEIKPVTHLEQSQYYSTDNGQLNGYLEKINDKTYKKGDAKIFFNFDTPMGYIYDKKGDQYRLKVIVNHNRTGFIYYRIERTGRNKNEDLKEDIKKVIKEIIKRGVKPEDIINFLPGGPKKVPKIK